MNAIIPSSGQLAIAECWYRGDWNTTRANARRIVACVNACVGVPTEALERAGECADHGVIPTLAAQYKAERDALHAIEMEWERAMMAAIGEDGVKSVSDAIGKLKAERAELLDTIKRYVDEYTIWEKAVIDIVGRTPDTGVHLEQARAAIAKAERSKP